MNKTTSFDTRKIVLLALFTAIVVLLQVLAIVTRPLFPAFAISLVLIPIVIGTALCGVFAGAWLGAAFAIAVLLSGDAAAFLVINPSATVGIVFIKGILAGLAAGAVYKKLAGKNETMAAISAAVICPVVNTGVFLIGSFIFFMPVLAVWGEAAGFGNTVEYIFVGLAGVNFLVEMLLNIVLSPMIIRLIHYGQNIWSKGF